MVGHDYGYVKVCITQERESRCMYAERSHNPCRGEAAEKVVFHSECG